MQHNAVCLCVQTCLMDSVECCSGPLLTHPTLVSSIKYTLTSYHPYSPPLPSPPHHPYSPHLTLTSTPLLSTATLTSSPYPHLLPTPTLTSSPHLSSPPPPSYLQVMVFLIDFTIPENYFAQNLYALSADMTVVKELMKLHLPNLHAHMERLRQKEVRNHTSFSSEDTPGASGPAYEPPLADVFTVQWFLTLFSISLPTKLVRKVWDTILVEGSEMMIYASLAIWELLERCGGHICYQATPVGTMFSAPVGSCFLSRQHQTSMWPCQT